MQLLIMERQRKPRPKRDTTALTLRISPAVKRFLGYSADKYQRSENQQAEFLIKVGCLNSEGISTIDMTDREILEKFDELSEQLEESQDDD